MLRSFTRHAKIRIIILYVFTHIQTADSRKLIKWWQIAVISTTPWNSYLIWDGTWSYASDAVTNHTLWNIPLKEIFFLIIQTYLTSLLCCIIRKQLMLPTYLRSNAESWCVKRHWIGFPGGWVGSWYCVCVFCRQFDLPVTNMNLGVSCVFVSMVESVILWSIYPWGKPASTLTGHYHIHSAWLFHRKWRSFQFACQHFIS